MDNKPINQLKLELNNSVISIKQFITQAKVQTINKLSKKVKVLKSRKGTEEQLAKHKKKSGSLVSEIMIIKKIQRNELSKFAMTNLENLDKIINNPEVSKERAMARLISHKSLIKRFEEIKRRYSDVPMARLLEQDPKKIRRKSRKEKLKQKSKKSSADNLKISEENAAVISTANFSVDSIDSDDSAKSNNLTDPSNSPVMKKKKKAQEKISHENEYNSNVASDDENSLKNENSSNEDEYYSDDGSRNEEDSFFLAPNSKLNKKTSEKNVRKRKSPENEQDNKMVIDMDELPSARRPEKTVDSFFVTNGGSDYMTMAVPRPADKLDGKDEYGNRKMRRAAQFGNKLRNPKKKPNTVNVNKYHKSDAYSKKDDSKNRLKRNNEFPRDNFPVADAKEKLHPSWQAKKQQSSILPFQGNKVVFE